MSMWPISPSDRLAHIVMKAEELQIGGTLSAATIKALSNEAVTILNTLATKLGRTIPDKTWGQHSVERSKVLLGNRFIRWFRIPQYDTVFPLGNVKLVYANDPSESLSLALNSADLPIVQPSLDDWEDGTWMPLGRYLKEQLELGAPPVTHLETIARLGAWFVNAQTAHYSARQGENLVTPLEGPWTIDHNQAQAYFQTQ